MRTIDPILQDGLNRGIGDFFVRVYIRAGATYSEKEVLAYEIDNLTASVTIPYESTTYQTWFYIQRGLKIEGIEYPVNSSKFRVTTIDVSNPKVITYNGSIFWNLSISTPGDTTAETVIENVALQSTGAGADYANTISYGDNAEWWHGINFLPAGKIVSLNTAKRLEQLLKQKYLAQMCEMGSNVIRIIGSSQYFEQPANFSLIENKLLAVTWKIENTSQRKFIWKDEIQTVHEYDENGPLHNLGYIESTVTPSFDRQIVNFKIRQSMPNLAMTNGDSIELDNATAPVYGPILIKEVFNPNDKITWYYEISAISWTSNTEGGAVPSTIERVSNYTPLNTSTFNGNLDATINNLQAFAERVDDMALGTGPATTAASDFQVGDGAGNWIKKTLAETKAILSIFADAASDSVYYVRRNAGWTNLKTYTDTLYAAITHAHAASDITSGTLDTARLPVPTTTAIGGVKRNTGSAGEYVTGIDASGNLEYDTPAGGGVTVQFNAVDIFRCDAPGGTSAFVGKVASLPGGAPTTITYSVTSGTEAAMVPTSTSQLAKMVLHNTTRGDYALITNCNTATNTLTFTANVPAGWAVNDVITIASQTVTGSGFDMVDVEITDSGLLGISALFYTQTINSATVGNRFTVHSFETFSAAKNKNQIVYVASSVSEGDRLLPIISNRFSLFWTGTPFTILMRLAGYI